MVHAVRDTLGTGLYFMTYESCKHFLTSVSGTQRSNQVPVLIAGGLCGVVSWAMICMQSPNTCFFFPSFFYTRMP